MILHPLDQIDAYLAGGLTDAERAEFEGHIAGCSSCAAALKEASDMDATVNQLFSAVRPVPGFEDRLIQRLKQIPIRRRLIHPMVKRVAIGVAAGILVASVGYVGNAAMNQQPILGSRQYARNVTSNLRQSGLADLRSYHSDVSDYTESQQQASRADEYGYRGDRSAGDKGKAALDGLNDNLAKRGLATASPAAAMPQAGSALAFGATRGGANAPQDDKDSFLLPTDDKGGDGEAQKKPANLSVLARDAAQLNDSKKKADLSYFSLSAPAGDANKTGLGLEQMGRKEGESAEAGAPVIAGRMAGGLKLGDQESLDRNGVVRQLEHKVEEKAAEGKQDKAGAVPEQPAPQPVNAGQAQPGNPNVQAPPPDPAAGRKVIRSGDMEFEVDSFDSAVTQISKIVSEEGGFVSTTESDKLPNGKVKGRVVLRCPPDRLDTLVLKLRGIGDLHTQKIGAQDITKQYTDLESGLRAARAMEERLLDIIKTGKGAVKDLLEAEKQLGVWREKIEQLEGEIRYYNNLVSLSTLSVTLFERDIKTPASASETEIVTMSVETEKVEDAYQKARDAIDQAKGRVTASELKQFDAGQYRATISALLPPDQAEAVIASVRQLNGRLAHFERQRSQSTSTGQATRTDPVRVKREDVVVNLTIYNLANIAPRRTTNLTVVATNVEEAYRSLIDQVNGNGGKVVTSTINRPSPEQTAGSINFNVPADKADAMLAIIRGTGEILKSDTAESPDTQNVTDAKRGFSLTIASLDAFRARESQQIQLAALSVPDEFNEVLSAARGKAGRVVNSQLNEQDRQNINGTLEFWVPRESIPAIEQAFGKSAEVVSRVVTRSNDTENTVDSKVHFQVTVTSSDRLPARETVQTQLAAASVPDAFNAIRAAIPKGGRLLVSELNEQDPQNVSATLVFDLPAASQGAINDVLKKQMAVISRQVKRIPEGQIAVEKVRFEAVLVSADRQSPRQIVRLGIQASDVDKAADDFIAAAINAGGREVENPNRSEDNTGRVTAIVIVDVPLSNAQNLLNEADRIGNRRQKQVSLDTHVPESSLSRARIEVTFSNSAATLGGQESMADYIRNGLMTSLKGLGYSLMWIIIGICLIAPWVFIIWGGWKLLRRSRRSRVAAAPA